jgi:hypothetical protein
MNVILNVEEVQAIASLVTSQVLDHVELSQQSREAVRAWRRANDVGSSGLDEYSVVFNEALGNAIDERTTRMLRQRGKVRVSAERGRSS